MSGDGLTVMSMSHGPMLLTAVEVAEILQVDPTTVLRWANEDRLRAVVLPSGRRRFWREDVDKILTGQDTDAA